ncbi:AraC family transcriptional regulator [Aeromicrobium sp. YIM 150415]|uniref:helix-turn-helix transcriptional regulator n=1 Tax=Aeromicrobium sp. YIM 150415 TaxID=2803912 RepID=UPI00196558C2|nr:AraC family transcriptional regulator [Aeromicrobium sp. YIM 150415]MBM9464459.1 AraC family transcriptional regulator [Aeromicrobium sp. YIM 150415]
MSATQRSRDATQRSHQPESTLGFDLTVNSWGHSAHAHTFGQLVHAISGRATFSIHDLDGSVTATHTIDTTSAIWIPPMVWHSARFAAEFAPSAHALELNRDEARVRLLVVDTTVRAELLATQWRPDRELVATRAALAAQDPAAEGPPPRPSGDVTRSIAEALDRDPADGRDLDDWAHELHTSTATIRRAFKSETGLTYSQWRTRHRLHAALTLLREGHRPSWTAAAVGYSEAGLAAAIRRQFACAPSALMPR